MHILNAAKQHLHLLETENPRLKVRIPRRPHEFRKPHRLISSNAARHQQLDESLSAHSVTLLFQKTAAASSLALSKARINRTLFMRHFSHST
jgi:hypothetical protein